MNSLKLLLLLLLILFGIYLFQLRFPPQLSNEDSVPVTPPAKKPTSSPHPSLVPTTEYMSPTQTQSSDQNDTYRYPGSSVTSGASNTYTTSDSVSIVTQWYKDLLTREGFFATTVIQTTTNGNVLNKLTAGNDKKKISVDITKTVDSENVTIVVSNK